MKAYIILSPGFEETEAITVIDILRRARIDATTVALNENTAVMGSHGIVVIADATLREIRDDQGDALVLPGGMKGVENMLANESLLALVQKFHDDGKVIAAVCAAPLIPDKLGILGTKSFTCHPCVYDRLQSKGVQDVPTITDGQMVTGRSAGCAMIWSLALVKKLLGDYPDGLLNGLRLDKNPL